MKSKRSLDQWIQGAKECKDEKILANDFGIYDNFLVFLNNSYEEITRHIERDTKFQYYDSKITQGKEKSFYNWEGEKPFYLKVDENFNPGLFLTGNLDAGNMEKQSQYNQFASFTTEDYNLLTMKDGVIDFLEFLVNQKIAFCLPDMANPKKTKFEEREIFYFEPKKN